MQKYYNSFVLSDWIEAHLHKYWQKKAQELSFLDFLCLYVDSMIAKNGIIEKRFRKKNKDLWDLYEDLRKG